MGLNINPICPHILKKWAKKNFKQKNLIWPFLIWPVPLKNIDDISANCQLCSSLKQIPTPLIETADSLREAILAAVSCLAFVRVDPGPALQTLAAECIDNKIGQYL